MKIIFKQKVIFHALYIPKMAYRPPGKDELHVSFFPSELEKNKIFILNL
jgi:hypothetical protein